MPVTISTMPLSMKWSLRGGSELICGRKEERKVALREAAQVAKEEGTAVATDSLQVPSGSVVAPSLENIISKDWVVIHSCCARS